jgi:hypothetical protein
LGTELACVLRDSLQLRLKVFDLNAESFLEILCTQKFFQKVSVCRNLPLQICFEIGYSVLISTGKALHGLFNHIDVALTGALHLLEIFKHEGLEGLKGVLICHGTLPT